MTVQFSWEKDYPLYFSDNFGKNICRLFEKIQPNLKTYDENVSIFQLKKLFTLKKQCWFR